jgi:hypothetical protein
MVTDPHHVQRGVADRESQEIALLVRDLEKPARPPPGCAATGVLTTKIADHGQCFLTRCCTIAQLDALIVAINAIAESEMEEIQRHCSARRQEGVTNVTPSRFGTNSVADLRHA